MDEIDWRSAHRPRVIEKQRRVSQTVAQVRELQALVRKWRHTLAGLDARFAGLERPAEGAGWVDRESLVVMGSVALRLERLMAEIAQIGDAKTIGSGTTGRRGSGSIASHVAVTGDPTVSWEIVWQGEPEVSAIVRAGPDLVGAESADPIDPGVVTVEESSEFEKVWRGVRAGLQAVRVALDGFDLAELEGLEARLSATLREYERIYDAARGDDDLSAAALGRLASGARRR